MAKASEKSSHSDILKPSLRFAILLVCLIDLCRFQLPHLLCLGHKRKCEHMEIVAILDKMLQTWVTSTANCDMSALYRTWQLVLFLASCDARFSSLNLFSACCFLLFFFFWPCADDWLSKEGDLVLRLTLRQQPGLSSAIEVCVLLFSLLLLLLLLLLNPLPFFYGRLLVELCVYVCCVQAYDVCSYM